MSNSKGWVQSDSKKLVQRSGKQHGVAIIKQIIQSATASFPDKFFIIEGMPKYLPEKFGANGFLVGFFTEGS